MWGAIIGDVAGSVYEYDQFLKTHELDNIGSLIKADGFFSDDTILKIGILNAILDNKKYDSMLRKYGKKYIDYKPDITPYFDKPFSPGFVNWINKKSEGKSNGHGAMMRISPVGYLFNTKEDVIKNAYLATSTSHDTKEAIDNATLVALIILLARMDYSKEEIIKELNISLKHNKFDKFNYTCSDTIDNCLYALFNSTTFEESITNIISYGGDTDTNACIVGAMAEALYGVNIYLIESVKPKLPVNFVELIERGYDKIKVL